MIYRIGSFELDEDKRALILDRTEVPLQPRVFDLLLCLLRHRDRVVTKDDLLDTIWPGVVVSDSALQRAISLARSALKKGGIDNAIRTYPRAGYRFCADVLTDSPATFCRRSSLTLDEAHDAFDKGDWPGAVESFSKADSKDELDGVSLERWGKAAAWSGCPADALAPLERAVASYSRQANRIAASRAAFFLAHIQFECRNASLARGWHHRGITLLGDNTKTHEFGLLSWLSARLALFDGRIQDALQHAIHAESLGKELDDFDVQLLGLLYRGIIVLAQGDVRQGEALQDEAAASVSSLSVSPWVGGTVFCGVIWGCLNRCDWKRATEWTDQYTRWCEQTGSASYPGLCRMHRAEVLGLSGELAKAEREILAVCEQVAESIPLVEGDAYRILGEIRLTKGDLEGADDAFRTASELGWDPNPGWALLQLRQGNTSAAIRELKRALNDRGWTNRQRHGLLLAHMVIVAAETGHAEEARRALDELEDILELQEITAFRAMLTRARGEVAFIEGDVNGATVALREAIHLWQEIGSYSNVGGTRCRLAQFLIADNDTEAAHRELAAAEAIFRRLGAPIRARECKVRRHELES